MENTTRNTAERRPTFEQAKREFETAYARMQAYTATPTLYTAAAKWRMQDALSAALNALSAALVYSVLNKCIDPQRKAAQAAGMASNSGFSPALVSLKRGVAHDLALLENTHTATENATRATFNKDGDSVTEILDGDAYDAIATLIAECLSDGIDLVQTAAAAILEQAEKHATGENWLDTPYTIRRLSKRVYIQRADSAAYKEDKTTPVQEAYRAVRRAVQDSRAVQVDPRNGYTYIENTTPDTLDTIYYRLGKYSDLGGYETSSHVGRPDGGSEYGGTYTAGAEDVARYDALIALLNLTDRQAQIIKLRMQGRGYKAIATYLGVSTTAVHNTLHKVQEKAKKLGYNGAKYTD